MKQIILPTMLLIWVACSKEDSVIHTAHTCKECSAEASQMPAFDKKLLAKWEKKKLQQ